VLVFDVPCNELSQSHESLAQEATEIQEDLTRSSSADEIANVNFHYCAPSSYVLEHRFIKFSEITKCNGECLTLTLLLGVIPCPYRHKWYIARNYILWVTFMSQKLSVYLQPLYLMWLILTYPLPCTISEI